MWRSNTAAGAAETEARGGVTYSVLRVLRDVSSQMFLTCRSVTAALSRQSSALHPQHGSEQPPRRQLRPGEAVVCCLSVQSGADYLLRAVQQEQRVVVPETGGGRPGQEEAAGGGGRQGEEGRRCRS